MDEVGEGDGEREGSCGTGVRQVVAHGLPLRDQLGRVRVVFGRGVAFLEVAGRGSGGEDETEGVEPGTSRWTASVRAEGR